jgi:predicted nucleic acid-binding protein
VRLGYADSSALVKLVVHEAESDSLRAAVAELELVSCELVLTEIPRAIRRIEVGSRPSLDALIARTGDVLGAVSLVPLDRTLLAGAGAIEEPSLRTLDAIHVTAAIQVSPLDAFITYDERQAAAARKAGLPVLTPGLTPT